MRGRRNRSGAWLVHGALWAILAVTPGVHAGSRVLATGGVTQIEGAAGGGLVPWAAISGYGSRGQVGASAFATHVAVDDLRLDTRGAALAWGDRAELSFARQTLEIQPLDAEIDQDVLGAKIRLAGRLPYTPMPQIAVGVQYKHNRDFQPLPSALGATDDAAVDVYLSASRLWFAAVAGRNLLASVTLRSTRAFETGLLGFGDNREMLLEGSLGLFLTDRLVVGAEYREKPEGLAGLDEDDWRDVYVAWFPWRNVSVTGAYVDLDQVALFPDQTGWYLSVEVSR